MDTYRILVVEDDADIRAMVKLYLEWNHYEVLEAENAVQAIKLFEKEKIHLALVDIVLPDADGIQLIEQWKESSSIPMIIISSKAAFTDKIIGLKRGADDYITKPFDPMELLVRIQAKLRLVDQLKKNVWQDKFYAEQIETVGEIMIDMKHKSVIKKQDKVELTQLEYALLELLVKKKEEAVSYRELYEYTIGDFHEADKCAIRVHMHSLRNKLEDDPRSPRHIMNIRGVGYSLRTE